MKILVTGSNGFVGKNLISALKTKYDYEIYLYDIDSDPNDLDNFTKSCNFIFHLAGVNRPIEPCEYYEGNSLFTEQLCKALKRNKNRCPILITSSIHASTDNDYGKSKKSAEEFLLNYANENDSEVYIFRLANLFGKWCRPNYNSVVATWCANIANGMDISISDKDVEIPLCYIDDVIREFLKVLEKKSSQKIGGFYEVHPIHNIKLGELANIITSFKDSRKSLQIPFLKAGSLKSKLYSTYLTYLPTDQFSYDLKSNNDDRGSFIEFLRTEDYGQVSINISKPGITKGNHWHHSKNEKFLVVSGNALIKFRNINCVEIIEYHVSGHNLKVIDIPPGYTHNITNIGKTDLVTVMWASELFNENNPDTFYLEV